jgi:hypothetical protein
VFLQEPEPDTPETIDQIVKRRKISNGTTSDSNDVVTTEQELQEEDYQSLLTHLMRYRSSRGVELVISPAKEPDTIAILVPPRELSTHLGKKFGLDDDASAVVINLFAACGVAFAKSPQVFKQLQTVPNSVQSRIVLTQCLCVCVFLLSLR